MVVFGGNEKVEGSVTDDAPETEGDNPWGSCAKLTCNILPTVIETEDARVTDMATKVIPSDTGIATKIVHSLDGFGKANDWDVIIVET